MKHIHAFTDFSLFDGSSSTKPFGQISESQYQLSSLFTCSSELPAYAITKGLAFVQNSDTSGFCNLILKPVEPLKIQGIQVKYYIYRGLTVGSFISGSDLITRGDSSISDLLKKMYEDWEDTTGILQQCMLRIDSGYNANKLIDEVFEEENENQLPIVDFGDTLGVFNGSNTTPFGVEILLEDPGFYPTLQIARASENILDIGGSLPSNPYDEDYSIRTKREEILHYIDIASFYGLHFNSKVTCKYTGGGSDNFKKEEIYNNIIQKLPNKNILYLDIRNENLHSFNFYDNYRINTDSFAKVKYSYDQNSPALHDYSTNRWPILSVDLSSGLPTGLDEINLNIQFPLRDNYGPVLFSPQKLITNDNKKSLFQLLIRDNTNWVYTQSIHLTLPVSNDNPYAFPSTLIRLYCHRQLDIEKINNIIDSESDLIQVGRVINKKNFFDNIFHPFSIKASWKLDVNPNATTFDDYIYWKISPGEIFDSWNATTGIFKTFLQGVAKDCHGETAFIINDRIVMPKKNFLGFLDNDDVKSRALKSISFSEHKVNSDGIFLEVYLRNQSILLKASEYTDEMDIPYKQREVEPDSMDVNEFEFDDPANPGNTITVKFPEILTSFKKLTGNDVGNILSFSYSFEDKQDIYEALTDTQNDFSLNSPVYYFFTEFEEDDYDSSDAMIVRTRMGLRGSDSQGAPKEVLLDLYFYSLNYMNFFSQRYYN